MNERQIRNIVRSEMNRDAYQTAQPLLPKHNHDGVNSAKISQNSVVPGVKFNGTVEMTKQAIYTIPITGNPSRIDFYGGAINATDGFHGFVVGTAVLGNCYQFQPGTETTTSLNDVKTGIIQGCSSFLSNQSATPTTIKLSNSQGHIIYISDESTDPSTLYVVADITEVTNSEIKVTVSTLATNWTKISGLWTVS